MYLIYFGLVLLFIVGSVVFCCITVLCCLLGTEDSISTEYLSTIEATEMSDAKLKQKGIDQN